MSEKNNSIQQMTDELEKLVTWFDSDEFVIELAVEKFKQAELLASEIEKHLNIIKNDIQIVKKKFDSQE